MDAAPVISLDRSRGAVTPAPLRNLSGLTRPELATALVENGAVAPDKAKMRAAQMWRWIHHHGVTDFAAMSNVSREMQATLAERFTLARPQVVERQVSRDGTRKWLIRFAPGVEAETVYIPDVGRSGALCVSSQVGCTLNCTFCHTGTQALVRNLTAAEITAQVQVARDDLEEWPSPKEERRLSNIVFMGMGEPLYNLDGVANAIDIVSDGEGHRHLAAADHRLHLRRRAGAHPARRRHPGHAGDLAPCDERRPARRAGAAEPPLSAGAADGRRARLSGPVTNARRVTFEYVMLKGVNDSPAEARALVKLIGGVPAKVNLIPFNPWPGSPYQCSDGATIEAFAAILNRAGYASPIRTPRGRDILAACGQLKSESEKLRASARRALETVG